MEAKGSIVAIIPKFIQTKFGDEALTKWLNALSPEARKTFSRMILPMSWYPLQETLTEPTKKMCELFYGGKTNGAYECGRFSADYALKGIYRLFLKLGSPEFTISKASTILPTFYVPSQMEVVGVQKGMAVLRITEFPQMNEFVEQRIVGWISRALELCGAKNSHVAVTASLAAGRPYSEFTITWAA